MPNLASKDTVDTASSDGTCIYNPAPIGGTEVPVPSILVGNKPLNIVAGIPFYQCDPITGVKLPIPNPLPCQPGTRRLTPTVNTTVFFEGKLPAVTGDQAQLVIGGSPRPLTAPFQHAKILIGSRL